MSISQADVLSTRDIANQFGVSLHCVVTVVDRLRLAQRIGRNRVIKVEHLERVELGLRAAGFLAPMGLEAEVG